jgi:hypothetical protein
VLRSVNVVTVSDCSYGNNCSMSDSDFCGCIITRKTYFHERHQNRETRVVLGLYDFQCRLLFCQKTVSVVV